MVLPYQTMDYGEQVSGGTGIDQASELNSIFTAQDVAGTKELKETELFFSKSGVTSTLYIYDDVNNNIPLQFTATQDNVDNNNNSVSISVDNVSSSALTLLGSKVGVNKAVPIYQLEVGGDIRGDDLHGDLLALQNNYTQMGTIYLQTDVVQLTTEMAGSGSTGGELVIKTKVPNSTITEKLRINGDGAIGIGGSNFGSAGQVLTSNGSTSSVSWTTPAGGGSVDRINIEVEGATTKKKQIIYDATKTITASDIVARLDGAPDKDQVYYFGESIPNRWVAVGSGSTNTLAYSSDGISWTGLGKTTFSVNAQDVAWNGSIYVAVGQGTNSIAYSSDGITWTGATSSTSIFSSAGRGVAWNGTRWVATGQGTNTLAYSSDGINWTGIGTSIFSVIGQKIVWNGSIFCAVGEGTNSIAYSSDGITWTGLGTSIFTSLGRCIGWNGFMFVAGGDGGNSVAYSYDGIGWTGLGTSIVTSGRGIGWDGRKWIVCGTGTNQINYSSNGIQWTSIPNIFTAVTSTVLWNGRYWVCGGNTPSHAWSIDGIRWTYGSTLSVFSSGIVSLAYNGKRENTITFSAGSTSNGVVSINGGTLTLSGGGTLDVVSENYFNQGFTNFALTIK